MQNYAKISFIGYFILHCICVMKHTYGFLMTIVPIPSKLHKYYIIMCANAYDSSPWLHIPAYNILILCTPKRIRQVYNVHNSLNELDYSVYTAVARGPCPYRYNNRVLNIISHIIIIVYSGPRSMVVPRPSSVCIVVWHPSSTSSVTWPALIIINIVSTLCVRAVARVVALRST